MWTRPHCYTKLYGLSLTQHEEPTKPASETTPQAQPAQPAPRRFYFLPYLLLLIFLLTLLPGPLFFVGLLMPGPQKETKTIIIPRGSSVSEIARILDQNDALIHPLLFRAASRLIAKDQLKAGEYEITPGQNVIDIATLLNEGKTVLRQVTIPEGYTSHEAAAVLRQTAALTGEIPAVPEEGSLLPETYNYAYGDTRGSLLARMQQDQQNMLQELWDKRAEGLPLKNMKEAIILASIVEKETGKRASERALVASVFINRLRLGMPLQSDPTVIYALTGGLSSLGRKLTRADLLTPSPMNSYVNAGLPPTPICNPGRAAIEAVLHPESSDYLYFVADGSGGHAFAKTLDEHNKNVAKWYSLNKP